MPQNFYVEIIFRQTLKGDVLTFADVIVLETSWSKGIVMYDKSETVCI